MVTKTPDPNPNPYPDPELCETCLFHDKTAPEYKYNNVGVCRRYPPSIRNKHGVETVERQPIVFDRDWCGEYFRDARIT